MKTCKVPGCDKAFHAKDYCRKHYNEARATGEIGAPKCIIESCTSPVLANDRCSKHYQIQRRRDAGLPLRERNTTEWRVNKKGYVVRKVPNGPNVADGWRHELQHRVVMAEHLGRPLLRHEEPHHKNGDRADNRIENLELWSTKQPKGQRVEDKLEFAREIIALYG